MQRAEDGTEETSMSNQYVEKVLSVHHWNDTLFSFRTTRNPAFRFEAGQFAMIGLMVEGRPLLRAYSMACAPYDEELEFLSIKVPDGPLTSRLQKIVPGDEILIGRKATGTLLHDNLVPGRNLYFLSTGTGLAPFMSLIRDPATYERFEKVVLVHGVRLVSELAYETFIREELPADELIGEMVASQLIYHPTVTREDYRNRGRVTELFASPDWFASLGLPFATAENDRVMLCGSPAMLADMKVQLEGRGFVEGSSSTPATYVVERAFVEK